ncbi:Diacylglycerol kinase [Posidoniimonas corsicana]|uniref:Diacylglycerol kinase n=1 Tax=Posidoniimonas corsicana TaxID=1938618 RepID=A0A5C5V4N3_9BACT|nr:diacylglycerol kinase family protein [Posidoniimonas corsicana]TWT33498.1 Diacylglycerol kinase [Posidoniimonas corsicana]
MPQLTRTPVYVLRNAAAGPANPEDFLPQQLQQMFGEELVVVETHTPEEGEQAVREACAEARIIVVAGGDGTINSVINTMMRCDRRPPLGLVPLGTGNNLCRALGVPLDPLSAYAALGSDQRVTIDLARASFAGSERYYACVASGGNSDRVIECLKHEEKAAWGPWCYLRSALPVMADLQAYHVSLEHDDGVLETPLWNIIVANGAFAAGGLRVAPRASMTDGLLDVVAVRDGTPLDLAALSAEFFLGDYLEDQRVTHLRTRRLRVEAQPELRFLADGEMLVGQPFEFEAVPAAIEVVVPR